MKPEELYDNFTEITFCKQQSSDEEYFDCLKKDPVQTDIVRFLIAFEKETILILFSGV